MKSPHASPIYIVILKNVFSHPLTVHKIFDLKGSWVNRGGSGDVESVGMESSRKLPLPPNQHPSIITTSSPALARAGLVSLRQTPSLRIRKHRTLLALKALSICSPEKKNTNAKSKGGECPFSRSLVFETLNQHIQTNKNFSKSPQSKHAATFACDFHIQPSQ